MKKKIIMTLVIILIVSISAYIGYNSYSNDSKSKNLKRYDEIKENLKVAVEKSIRVQYPKCVFVSEIDEDFRDITHYNSSFLIQNGYIKKEELIELDKESYCDVFVRVKWKLKNPNDQMNNCQIHYNMYLKCKDLEEKGYQNWG